MRTIEMKGWGAWRTWLHKYATTPKDSRALILFRGQSDARWNLEPTLDRQRDFRDDAERGACYFNLISEFRREAYRVSSDTILPDGTPFELLARHHGIPSNLLDWTTSPYIATYFAFEGSPRTRGARVAIWALNRSRYDVHDSSRVDFIDDLESIRYNPRALQQRGVFTRIATSRRPFEDLFGAALTKLTIPAKDRKIALAELEEMSINAASLFPDLDGAARAARARLGY